MLFRSTKRNLQKIKPKNLLEPLTISLDHNTYNMKKVYEGTIYFKITFKKKEEKKERVNVIHIRKKKKVELKESQS